MRRFRSARRRTHRTDGCSSIWTSGFRRAATERIVPYCSLSTLLFSPFELHRPFFTQRPFASTGITPLPRYYGLVRLLASLSLPRGLPSSLAELSEHATLLCPAEFHPPKSVRRSPVGFIMSEQWPRGDFNSNETLRKRFTCVIAYPFVRRDSRTSVALCTACRPNRMSISLRYSSFRY